MPLFEQFPYTNFHELNLSKIIEEMKKLNSKVDEYLTYATITYADPILWDITTQYVKNTIVVSSTGTAYLSTQPVPSGIAISDTNYWTPIGNFTQLWDDLKASICGIDLGDSTSATQNISEGELFFQANDLYQASTNIVAGSLIVPGGNASAVTVEDFVNAKTAAVISQIVSYDAANERVVLGGSLTAVTGGPVSEIASNDEIHPIDFATYDSVNDRISIGKPGSSQQLTGDNVAQFAIGNDVYAIALAHQLFGANALVYTVGTDANYSTINDALNDANAIQNGTKVILIEPGTYYEQINLLPAYDIVLFGLGQVTVVGDGVYPYGCLYVMGAFRAYNINFRTLNQGTGYAYHYEDGNLSVSGGQYFYNCEFLGAYANAVGIGLGSNVIQFINCRMTTQDGTKSGVYAHNSAGGQNKSGYLILDNCRIDGRMRLDDVSTQYSTNNTLEVQAFNCHGTTIFEFYDYNQTLPYVPDGQKVTISAASHGNNHKALNYLTRNSAANTVSVVVNSITSGDYVTFFYPDADRFNWSLYSSSPAGAVWTESAKTRGSVNGSVTGVTGFVTLAFTANPKN